MTGLGWAGLGWVGAAGKQEVFWKDLPAPSPPLLHGALPLLMPGLESQDWPEPLLSALLPSSAGLSLE